jgi:hypothetical protein
MMVRLGRGPVAKTWARVRIAGAGAGGEEVGEGEDCGGAGGVVVGTVEDAVAIDGLGGDAEVVEVRGEEDDLVLKFGV